MARTGRDESFMYVLDYCKVVVVVLVVVGGPSLVVENAPSDVYGRLIRVGKMRTGRVR